MVNTPFFLVHCNGILKWFGQKSIQGDNNEINNVTKFFLAVPAQNKEVKLVLIYLIIQTLYSK